MDTKRNKKESFKLKAGLKMKKFRRELYWYIRDKEDELFIVLKEQLLF